MVKSVTIGTSGGNKAVTEIYIGTSGGNKLVTEGWVGTPGGNKQFWPPLAPLTAVANPSSQVWTGGSGLWLTTSDLACAAGGGSGVYTYAWETVSDPGGLTVIDDTTGQTTGAQNGTVGTAPTVTFKCLVSDDAGSTPVYSNTIEVTP